MIHFDFIVTDLEAETIMDGLQELVITALQQQMKALLAASNKITGNRAMLKWSKMRLEFLEELKNKMKNTRV
jgi:hypothetical protein